MTKDEMVGWHHQFNGQEFDQTPGNGEGQGSLVCCSPWGHKELNLTEQLNNNNQSRKYAFQVQVGVQGALRVLLNLHPYARSPLLRCTVMPIKSSSE